MEKSLSNTQPEKGVLLAAKVANEHWIPPRPETYTSLFSSVFSGSADSQIDEKGANALSSDLALFSLAIKNLFDLVANQKITIDFPLSDPFIMLKALKKNTWRKILPDSRRSISCHINRPSTTEQIKRIEFNILTSSAVELLSESFSIDPTLATSSTLLRQLGVTVIAWNYPTVYKRGLISRMRGQTLDHHLTINLGFSPFQLGVALMNDWQLSGEVRYACGEKANEANLKPYFSQLKKLCILGEKIAKSQQIEFFPEAAKECEQALVELEVRIGPGALNKILDKADIKKSVAVREKVISKDPIITVVRPLK